MKRYVMLILTVVATMFYSCGNIDDCSVDVAIGTSAYIINNGLQEVSLSSLKNSTYQVHVYKSGYNGDKIKLDLAVADSLITQYNAKNSTSYTLMPSQYYTVGSDGVSLSTHHYRDSIPVTFNSSVASDANYGTYLLPLVLTTAKESNLSVSYKGLLIHVSK